MCGELDHPERFADCAPGYVEQLFRRAAGAAIADSTEPEANLDLVSPGTAGLARRGVDPGVARPWSIRPTAAITCCCRSS
jgi:hypothetical protein